MDAKPANGKRTYLYAIVDGPDERTYAELGIGGAPVYAVCSGGLAAVVSDLPNGKVRPERRNLAAHQEVLRRLLEESAVLPMSFGMVAEGADAVRGLLSRHRRPLTAQLHRVAGKVEMGLRVTLDVPDLATYLVETDPELREARDRVFGTQREPSQDERIEIGRLLETTLQNEREHHTRRLEAVLAPHCSETKRGKLRSDREVANLACLVRRDALAEFEASVLDAAVLFDDHFAFDYNGPWAPHSFADVDLKR